MAGLRLVLILLLAVAGDFAPSPLLEAREGVEESEETFHRSRSRRSLRLIQKVSLPTSARQVQAVSVLSPARVPKEPSRRTLAWGQTRKTPPPIPDSASRSEDH